MKSAKRTRRARPAGTSPARTRSDSSGDGTSAEAYRLIVEGVKDFAIFLLDTQGRILFCNPGAERIKGYRCSEMVGRHLSLFYTPEDIKRRLPESEMKSAARNGSNEDEGWRVRKDGGRFWADEVVTALRDPRTKKLVGFSKITRDLTARKQADEALRRSEEQYRLVVEGVRDYAIFTLDLDNRVTTWNPGAQRIMGFSEAEAVGRRGAFIFTPEDRRKGAVERELKQAIAEGRAEDERWHLRKDGSRFWASGILMALRGTSERPLGFVKILRDITERKRMEDELRAVNESLEERVSQRTAEMAQYQRQLRSLAAELARTEQRERGRLAEQLHDHLAQTLAVCKMRLSALRKAMTAGPRSGPGPEGGADYASESADGLRDLLQEALGYTRTLISDLRPAVLSENDLPAAIEWVAERMQKQHGLRVRVRDDGRPKPLDEDVLTALFQSVRELLFNVVKHAGVSEATVSLAHVTKPRPSVMLEVSDGGAGFDAAGRRLAPTEEGGFGLFSIRERIDLMGGRVDVASSPGKGTRVTLTTPLKKSSDKGQRTASEPQQTRLEPPVAVTEADDSAHASATAGDGKARTIKSKRPRRR